MTPAEIVDLLTLCAVYDQRTGGHADVHGWHAVAQLEPWTAPVARRVVIEHYARGADKPRITPAAITDGIRAARRRAADSFAVPDPPWHLSGRDYPAWLRAQRDTHIARVLDGWSAGQQMPDPVALPAEQAVALTAGPDLTTCPAHLRNQIAHGLSRAGRERKAPQRASQSRFRWRSDPDRREQAAAELAAIRPPDPPPLPAGVTPCLI